MELTHCQNISHLSAHHHSSHHEKFGFRGDELYEQARCQKTHCMLHLQCFLSTGFKMCAIQSCEGDSTMKTTHTSDRCNFWTSLFLIPFFFFLIIWLDFILILWLCVSTRYFSHSPETSPSRCLSVFPAGKTQVTLMATVVRSVRRRGD